METRKLVCGVGNNNADYVVQRKETVGYVDGKRKQKQVWTCPYYRIWASMIDRCYSDKTQNKNPTYRGCSVSEEWLTFSVFKGWMEKQNWEGRHLDKDLLFEGNKIYSADTCVFVTQAVNNFTLDSGAARGEGLIGACWNQVRGKFKSRCRNPFTRKTEFLGYFDCEQEAHEAWLKRKLELAHLLAAEQEDARVAEALINRYSK